MISKRKHIDASQLEFDSCSKRLLRDYFIRIMTQQFYYVTFYAFWTCDVLPESWII